MMQFDELRALTMEAINEEQLTLAHDVFGKTNAEEWHDIVKAARALTMDRMSLDDLPTVALAIARAKRLWLATRPFEC